jgi:hypothetical protein
MEAGGWMRMEAAPPMETVATAIDGDGGAMRARREAVRETVEFLRSLNLGIPRGAKP